LKRNSTENKMGIQGIQTAVSSSKTPVPTGISAYTGPDGTTQNSYKPHRTITLTSRTLSQVHGMLISAVLRARAQLAQAKGPAERDLYEADLADCTVALDEFTQAVRGC
jgi:hypothetical protein